MVAEPDLGLINHHKFACLQCMRNRLGQSAVPCGFLKVPGVKEVIACINRHGPAGSHRPVPQHIRVILTLFGQADTKEQLRRAGSGFIGRVDRSADAVEADTDILLSAVLQQEAEGILTGSCHEFFAGQLF